MSLEKYQQRRHFSQTPEPTGEKQNIEAEKLIFVVQKHNASHLHYDLRLEKDGVLKSWAVPKGPSMDPNEKRLAIQVEDHPIEYAKFHGVIPEGNYGAGTVKIWDTGTYIPIFIDNNHWEFILKGKKLKGEFSLIRTKFEKGGKDWLLIKMKHDDEDLKKKSDDKMPHKIKPMLATLVENAFDKSDWIYEIKWDGYRAISEIEKNKVRLYSRNLQPFEKKFESIVDELKKINHNTVLDGEIVALDKNGKPSFEVLQNYQKYSKYKLTYYVFDILYLDGTDLQHKPLWERRKILKQLLPKNEQIKISDEIVKDGVAFFEAAKKEGLEGIMAKDTNSIYQQGIRSKSWLKIKTHQRQEAIICGFTQPKGSREKIGALVLGVYIEKKLKYIGRIGTGFDEEKINFLYKKMKPLIQKMSPFDEVPKTNTPVTWVKPVLICEVKFQEWTRDGLMRQPVFIGLREDKKSFEVVQEHFFGGENQNNKKNEIMIIDKQKINISHIDKIFWPEEKYTKRDLISYYLNIADTILPYLKDRPESLLRYPDGINGEKFFHKNIDFAPDWVETIKIKSDSEKKTINYLLCQNKATLVYLINLGCIDLNPWGSRIENLENPDYMIIDLDLEETDFKLAIKTALMAHKIMDEAGIPNYIKTTGLKGLHIYSPLEGKYNYEQARQLAQIIAIKINEELPEITSMERSPTKRRGKVYLDCFQNARGQTLAAPYSVRAFPGATVSAPLEWNEINEKLSPSQFTIKNMPDRIKMKGDLFKPVLGQGFDMKKVLKLLTGK